MRARWILPVLLTLGCATGSDEPDGACAPRRCDEGFMDDDAEIEDDALDDDALEDDASPPNDTPAWDDGAPLADLPVVPDAATPDAGRDAANDDGPRFDAAVDEASPADATVDAPAPVDAAPDRTPAVDAAPDRTPAVDAAPDVCVRPAPTVSGHAERSCSGGCTSFEELRGEGSSIEVRSDDRRDRITFSAGVSVSGRVRDVVIRSVRASGNQIFFGSQSLTLSSATASGSVDFGSAELATIDGAGSTLRVTDTRGVSGVLTLTGTAGCP